VHAASAKTLESPAKFIAAADAALYSAKHQGRNRVVMA
jgi:PleD family two-component response regulator